MVVYMNGQYVKSEEAKISVWDHGFLYGDGVFEGIRAYGGKLFKLRDHLVRLYKSAKSLKITIPVTLEEMEKAVVETCRKNDLRDAYVRLVVSRGVGDLGIDPRKCKAAGPTVVIIADKIALYPRETYEVGLKVVTASTRKNISAAFNAQIKSLNYLNNILAKIEAIEAGAAEALMVNREGFVTECTTENIFIFTRGTLITPPVYVGILEGITRNTIIERAQRRGIAVREEPFTPHDIYVADECFVTGTGAEVIPVVLLDGRTIGDGVPGKVTMALLEDYRALTASEGTPLYE
ncbi:MAG: branched-chain-amino-acid transaminase [Candidatus Eremiobacteraeota bacterium]|nr:branched-chain-amino-acid transaminase [Candidatus Eremiobacteraeota bacterium]